MRLADWELRLHDYIAGLGAVRFGYDHARRPRHLDCCVFAAGSVEAVTGIDPMAEFRGRYTNKRAAARALREVGAGTLEATIASKFADVEPAYAQRGDLIMHQGSIGVCIGADALFVGSKDEGDGLVRVPRREWQRAWKVG